MEYLRSEAMQIYGDAVAHQRVVKMRPTSCDRLTVNTIVPGS